MTEYPAPTVPEAIDEMRRWVTKNEGELIDQIQEVAAMAARIHTTLLTGATVASLVQAQDFETLMRRSALVYAWACEVAARRETLDGVERMTRNHLRAVTS